MKYIVLEYISGRTFESSSFRNGPLPMEEAVDIAVQLCEAVAHAHEHGLIHRGLSSRRMC